MLANHRENQRRQYFTYNENYDYLNSLEHAVGSWSCDQFVEWLKGVDGGIISYLPKLKKANITGKELRIIDEEYLENIGVYSFGIRRIIMQAVETLLYFSRDNEKDNLQRLMNHCVYKLDMLINCVKNSQTASEQLKNASKENYKCSIFSILNSTYSVLALVIEDIKKIVFWLDRSPFDRIESYIKIRDKILSDCVDLTNVVSVRTRGILKTNTIFTKGKQLREYLMDLIKNKNDVIFFCSSFTDRAVIKKNEAIEWGINIQSSFRGIHVISEIKPDSPADNCPKVEAGDEILQINGITVIGWELTKVASMLMSNDSPSDIKQSFSKQLVLLLNKRPQNPTTTRRFLNPNNMQKEIKVRENRLKTLNDFSTILSPSIRAKSPIKEDSPNNITFLKLARTASLNIAKSAWRNHNQRFTGSTIQFASLAHFNQDEDEEPKKIKRRNSICSDKPSTPDIYDHEMSFEVEEDNEKMRRDSFMTSYLRARKRREVFRQSSNDTLVLEEDLDASLEFPNAPNIVIRRTRRMRQQPDSHVKSFIDNKLIEESQDGPVQEYFCENEKTTDEVNYAEIDIVSEDNLSQLGFNCTPNVSDTDWSAPIKEITKLVYHKTDRRKESSIGSLESPAVNNNFYFESSPSTSATPQSNNFSMSPTFYNRLPLSPFVGNLKNRCFTPASTTFTDISEEIPSSRQSPFNQPSMDINKTTSPALSTSSQYSNGLYIHRARGVSSSLAPLAEPDDVDNFDVVPNEVDLTEDMNSLRQKLSDELTTLSNIPCHKMKGFLIEGWVKYLQYGITSPTTTSKNFNTNNNNVTFLDGIQKSQSGTDISSFLNSSRWKNGPKWVKCWAAWKDRRYLIFYTNQKAEKAEGIFLADAFTLSSDHKLKSSKKNIIKLSNGATEVYMAPFTKEDAKFWYSNICEKIPLNDDEGKLIKAMPELSYHMRSAGGRSSSTIIESPFEDEGKGFFNTLISKSKLLSRKGHSRASVNSLL
uniref:PH domain-containing protein n=1 Tax=Rhabditophanes sp. KR3021 TaxID=114890 RepID=A0AC35TUS6_9BILA